MGKKNRKRSPKNRRSRDSLLHHDLPPELLEMGGIAVEQSPDGKGNLLDSQEITSTTSAVKASAIKVLDLILPITAVEENGETVARFQMIQTIVWIAVLGLLGTLFQHLHRKSNNLYPGTSQRTLISGKAYTAEETAEKFPEVHARAEKARREMLPLLFKRLISQDVLSSKVIVENNQNGPIAINGPVAAKGKNELSQLIPELQNILQTSRYTCAYIEGAEKIPEFSNSSDIRWDLVQYGFFEILAGVGNVFTLKDKVDLSNLSGTDFKLLINSRPKLLKTLKPFADIFNNSSLKEIPGANIEDINLYNYPEAYKGHFFARLTVYPGVHCGADYQIFYGDPEQEAITVLAEHRMSQDMVAKIQKSASPNDKAFNGINKISFLTSSYKDINKFAERLWLRLIKHKILTLPNNYDGLIPPDFKNIVKIYQENKALKSK